MDSKFIVYKSEKLFARNFEERIELKCFFVKRIRPLTDYEKSLVPEAHGFDIDFYDSNFPLAIGPKKIRSVTIVGDSSELSELYGVFVSEMFKEGLFEPDVTDVNKPVVVGVASVARHKQLHALDKQFQHPVRDNEDSRVVFDTQESPSVRDSVLPVALKRERKCTSHIPVDADSILNSLPLPAVFDEVDEQQPS
jgi:hypothetical protein